MAASSPRTVGLSSGIARPALVLRWAGAAATCLALGACGSSGGADANGSPGAQSPEAGLAVSRDARSEATLRAREAGALSIADASSIDGGADAGPSAARDSGADAGSSSIDGGPPSADAAPAPRDANVDGGKHAVDDGSTDARLDTQHPPDTGADAALPPGCNATSMRAYVVDTLGSLHAFDPDLLTFTTLGTPSCISAFEESYPVAAMAVNRAGIAWVLTAGGAMSTVNLADLSCGFTQVRESDLAMTFAAPSGGAWTAWGMGMAFTSAAAGSSEETLFIGGSLNGALATIDMTFNMVHPIGYFDSAAGGTGTDLTGSADGSLHAVFGSPAQIDTIDQANASIVSSVTLPIPPVSTDPSNALALLSWKGSFYVFTAQDGPTSDVTRYDGATGVTTRVLSQIGFKVVGAGRSTCVE